LIPKNNNSIMQSLFFPALLFAFSHKSMLEDLGPLDFH